MSSGGSYSTPVAVKEERLLCCGRARSMTEQDIASLYSLLEVSSLSGYHKLLRRPKAVRERHLTGKTASAKKSFISEQKTVWKSQRVGTTYNTTAFPETEGK
ncbi:uncharacterized protein LOC108252734 isoform X2 [Diaphorina citri]|uniref:Uncharacterized protein LOC108252734 isoform X2 n=1 Tax=Diaphorina citri TaxID=121845 RepID=A0A3Q0J3Y1_DIACI|nr:uncharacterized protein LOC108252734 isoform X2 [Diaphorina citri]